MLARSLKVGTTMVSSGAGRTAAITSAPRAKRRGRSWRPECRPSPTADNAVRLSIGRPLLPYPRARATSFPGLGKGPRKSLLSRRGQCRIRVPRKSNGCGRARPNGRCASRFRRPSPTGVIQTGQRFIDRTAEGTTVLAILAAFVARVDAVLTHLDRVGRRASRRQRGRCGRSNFAFGYKHPPMTGWLFMLWFSVFPRQQWAADLLNVTTARPGLRVTWRLLRDHLDRNRALARPVRADAHSALRHQGGGPQRQHRDDSVLGGDAAVLSARAPRARRRRCFPGRCVREPHRVRQILGAVSVRRHGGCCVAGPGRGGSGVRRRLMSWLRRR